jgi:hypothetical protein
MQQGNKLQAVQLQRRENQVATPFKQFMAIDGN